MHYGGERSLSSVDQACPASENRLIYTYTLYEYTCLYSLAGISLTHTHAESQTLTMTAYIYSEGGLAYILVGIYEVQPAEK